MTTPSTILIVDDNAANRDTLIKLLQNPDYQLVEAAAGPQALKLAGEWLPDLILLDVMMPEMDGFEVCRRLRAIPRARRGARHHGHGARRPAVAHQGHRERRG